MVPAKKINFGIFLNFGFYQFSPYQKLSPRQIRKTKFPLSIKLIVRAYTREGNNRTMGATGGVGNASPLTMRFSVKDINGASLRSANRGGSEALRTMYEFEGVKKRIVVEGKGGGKNVTLRTASGGGNGSTPAMRFSIEGGNGASPRSASGGGIRAPRTMDKYEGVKKRIVVGYKGVGINGTLITTGGAAIERRKKCASLSKALMERLQEATTAAVTERQEQWMNVKEVVKAVTGRPFQEGIRLSTPMENRIDQAES